MLLWFLRMVQFAGLIGAPEIALLLGGFRRVWQRWQRAGQLLV